jgi:hypothetical protein
MCFVLSALYFVLVAVVAADIFRSDKSPEGPSTKHEVQSTKDQVQSSLLLISPTEKAAQYPPAHPSIYPAPVSSVV